MLYTKEAYILKYFINDHYIVSIEWFEVNISVVSIKILLNKLCGIYIDLSGTVQTHLIISSKSASQSNRPTILHIKRY